MFRGGLTSVTFRKLSYAEVIGLAREAGLGGIEWGGDVHLPPGRVDLAKEIAAATAAAGLSVFSYGSYYRLAAQDDPAAAFAPVLETAAALGAKTIRVWAGEKGSAQSDGAYFEKAAEDARIIADLAKTKGIVIAFEYHRHTLTDTVESALALLDAVGRENVKTYWQPNPELAFEKNLADLSAVRPFLESIHVFHWAADGTRLALADGCDVWRAYLDAAVAAETGGDEVAVGAVAGAAAGATVKDSRNLILEFVKDDDTAQFLCDAAALRELVVETARPCNRG